MKPLFALSVLFLTACAQEPQVMPVAPVKTVISSKPYRYIHYSKEDTPETIKQVRDHNYRHSLVKKAEEEALKSLGKTGE